MQAYNIIVQLITMMISTTRARFAVG